MTKKTTANNDSEQIKKIPYGLTDFNRIREELYYYIDKTSFLPKLEKAGSYLFFIRPRRFGKSLFISIMEAYYDVYYKDRFDDFFQGTFIHENPTPEKNSYLVLTFDFSQVNPDPEEVKNSFLEHVRGQVEFFLLKYREYLGENGESLLKRLYEIETASDILSALSRLCRATHVKSYILIDEYDNFANTILSSTGKTAYHDLTHGEGFFRAFFNVLKGGTSRMEAPFTRLFLTGVSPITMDDVTSGYNIGKNISLKPIFNRMLGFTRENIEEMLGYYKSAGLIEQSNDVLFDILDCWYGNYLFSEDDEMRMYNSDMVLYFLDEYLHGKKFPKELIDENVKIDYGKLRHLIIIDQDNNKTTNGNFSRLKGIIENGMISSHLTKAFPLEEITDTDNFISLLYYFGLLTIQGIEMGDTVLTIPNETIRKLYYEYIKKGYEETDVFSLDFHKYRQFVKAMAYKGEWRPFFEYLTSQMKESMSLRDAIKGEISIQAFLNVYLGLSKLYIIHPERELNKGYCDLLMEPFLASFEGVQYSYILELKYIPRMDKKGHTAPPATPSAKAPTGKKKEKLDKKIGKLVKDAEAQLAQYSADEKLAKTLAKTTLIKLVLVFHGHEAVYIGQAKS